MSCNVGIGGESDFEMCSLKGKTAPSLSALFFPLSLGLNGYHRLHFFLQPFWYDVFPLPTAVFLEESFRTLLLRKTGKHGRIICILLLKKLRLSENGRHVSDVWQAPAQARWLGEE